MTSYLDALSPFEKGYWQLGRALENDPNIYAVYPIRERVTVVYVHWWRKKTSGFWFHTLAENKKVYPSAT